MWRVLDDLWPRLVFAGVDVVLDFGYRRRAERNRARGLAEEVGADALLHWVRTPDEVARDRCVARAGADSFVVDSDAFEALKMKFEPLGPDEDHVVYEG